ncbi:MAG: ABC-2 transporter permease [bacterium]|nr:ABC-2 transporter permease [bacterium]
MNMMSLLYKELIVNKIYLLIVLPSYLGILIFGFIFLEEEPTMFYYIFVEFPVIIIATFVGFDEFKKGEILFCSLPVGRKRMAYSKYLTAMVLAVFCFLLAMLTAVILNNFFPSPTYDRIMTFSSGFTAVLICLFLISVILPLIMRLGTLIGMALFAAFIAVYFFVIPRDFYLNGIYTMYKVSDLAKSMTNIPVLIIVLAAIMSLSIFICGRLYENKNIARS